MKKFSKLIPAFCMLLISAMLMGTSTFAWFSMNKTVTATGMTVTAKSNSTFLLINNDGKKGTEMTTNTAEIAAKAPASVELYPVAFFKTVDDSTIMGKKKTAGGLEDFNLATDGSVTTGSNKWITANNENYDNANQAIINVKEVKDTDTDFANYVATYQVWLTLSKDSADISKKVKATWNKTTGNEGLALRAVVKIGGEYLELDALNDTKTMTANIALSSGTATEVTVYVYIDGNADNVNSKYFNENTGKLNGEIDIKFDLVD